MRVLKGFDQELVGLGLTAEHEAEGCLKIFAGGPLEGLGSSGRAAQLLFSSLNMTKQL